MTVMSRSDQRWWRACLGLAALCAAYAVLVAGAVASPIPDSLPADHPCHGAVDVQMVSGLIDAQGEPAGATANVGVRRDGRWLPMSCQIDVDPIAWANWEQCDRERALMHEEGHIGGHGHDEGGLMSTDWTERQRVAVPGCPAIVPSLRERIIDAVLERVPRGWSVSCGPRRGLVLRCLADGEVRGRTVVRRFRARLWDRLGTGFTVVRVKSR